MSKEINPASVLIFLRSRGPTESSEIDEEFGIQQNSVTFLQEARLGAVLDDLCKSGLVTKDRSRYEVAPLLDEVQRALHISLNDLLERQRPESDASRDLHESMRLASSAIPAEAIYREDFITTLEEMRKCLNARCYIAVLCLSGKCLELCLKQRMTTLDVSYDDSWMLGKLLERARSVPGEYFDPSLGNIANIINQSRIPAVHAKRAVPVPSKEQAMMVVNAVLDVISRTLLRPAPAPP